MTPLDLSETTPRPPRAMIAGAYFLPRTIDKLRAELPGGNIGPYLNHDTGFGAWMIRRLGLDMGEFRTIVAIAPTEDEVERWLESRVDPALAQKLNAKMETFVVSRMSSEDQALIRERHPAIAMRPELEKVLDILEADDRLRGSSRA